MKKLFERVDTWLSAGKPVMLVTVIEEKGSTPRSAGAMMATAGSDFVGTIGGGAVEYECQKLAIEGLLNKTSFARPFLLRPNEVADLGMVCGGDLQVYFQYIAPTLENKNFYNRVAQLCRLDQYAWLVLQMKNDATWRAGTVCEAPDGGRELQSMTGFFIPDYSKLLSTRSVYLQDGGASCCFSCPLHSAGKAYLFGGGHVAQALVPVLTSVDFPCVVIDNKPEFTDRQLFPDALDTVTVAFSDFFLKTRVRACDQVIIMTRGHENDYEVLREALKTPAYYIGLIGSRKKIATTRKRLNEDGFSDMDFDRVHTPIGLDIGAETPAEIAVSIAAEMIAERAKRNGR